MSSAKLYQHVGLSQYNTLGVNVSAKYMYYIKKSEQASHILQSSVYLHEKSLILGDGSNILFTQDYDGLIIKIDTSGIKKVKETQNHVWLQVASGENWNQFVMYTLSQDWGGLENLSLIPGTAGAAPIQNIGAYGVEIKDLITSVEAVNMHTGNIQSFTQEACQFAYRTSIFKKKNNPWLLTKITLILTKRNHNLSINYSSLKEWMQQHRIEPKTPQIISKAVIAIRRSKLPDPNEIRNAGSFFKNPLITLTQYEALKSTYANMPGYITSDKQVKVPAGWLIEQLGWKGKKIGNAGVYAKQSLVLVNYGEDGKEVWNLAQTIQQSVYKKYHIKLVPEVNIC